MIFIMLNSEMLIFHKIDSDNSEYHIEWQEGPCHYIDDNGETIQHDNVWHRHPLGNEYAEIWKNN